MAKIDFPEPSRTFSSQEHYDPSVPPKLPVKTVQGTLFHGIQYQDPSPTLHGRFKQVSSLKRDTKRKANSEKPQFKQVDPSIPHLRNQGLALAKASQIKADMLMKRVHVKNLHSFIQSKTIW